jgi:DNA-binding response OmpR family regulator
MDLACEFKQKKPELVILILSAMNDPDTKVHALELGAQDYITKPFNLKELTLAP